MAHGGTVQHSCSQHNAAAVTVPHPDWIKILPIIQGMHNTQQNGSGTFSTPHTCTQPLQEAAANSAYSQLGLRYI